MKKFLIIGMVLGIFTFSFHTGFGQENNSSSSITEREKEATHLYLNADKLDREGKYAEAIATYKKIAKEYPDWKGTWQTWSGFANIYRYNLKNPNAAIAVYKKGVKKTGDLFLISSLAECFAYDKQDLQEAIKWYERLIDSPKYNPAYDGGVAQDMINLIKSNPEYDYQPLKLYLKIRKGNYWEHIKNVEDITDRIENACLLVKKYPQSKLAGVTWFIIGSIYRYQPYGVKDWKPNYEKAIEAYRTAIKEYPNAVFEYRYIPFCDTPNVGAPFRKFIAPLAQKNIAAIYEENIKDYPKAIKEYENLIQMFDQKEYYDPTDERGSNLVLVGKTHIAEIYEKAGDHEKAMHEYSDIASQFPNASFETTTFVTKNTSAERYFKVAEILEKSGKYKEAAENYKYLILHYPNTRFSKGYGDNHIYSSEALHRLKDIFLKNLKDPKKAIEEFQDILRSISLPDRSFPERREISENLLLQTQYAIGQIYQENLKDPEKAIEEYKKVIALAPEMSILKENVSEGDFGGLSLTFTGEAKYRIEEIQAEKENRVAFASMFDDHSEYIWDKRYLIIDEPQNLNKLEFFNWKWLAKECGFIRGEILARHGYVFSNDTHEDKLLFDRFSHMPWYKPNPNFHMELLSKIEKRNVEYLESLENAVNSGKKGEELEKLCAFTVGWYTLGD